MYKLVFVLTTILRYITQGEKWDEDSPFSAPPNTNSSTGVEFNETRARILLRTITNFGSRTTGSSRERSASIYILKQLWNIRKHSKTSNPLCIQFQPASGHFYTDFVDGMTVYYRAVTNLVAKIGPPNSPSLLLACHYDTLPSSTGATSSAFHCSVMIELLYVISQYESTIENSIVFLFCAASEYTHLSAHGFVTKHPWSKNVTAFINMDSIGTEGRLTAIEAGPDNTWMIEGFAYSVTSPLASIIIQEIVNSGVFWRHTDFKAFCHIGKWPGLDLSYAQNGYLQRTKYDNGSKIALQKFSRTGKDLLALIKKLLKSPYLLYPEPFKNAKFVYFDVLGCFLVSYSTRLGTVMSEIICLLTILEMAIKIKLERVEGTSLGDHVIDIFSGFIVTAFGCSLATGWNAALGVILEIAGHSMTWYTKTYWIVGLYVCPSLACFITTHWIAAYVRRKTNRLDWLAEDKFYDSTRVFWIILTCTLSRCDYQVAYVCITWVLFPTIIRSLLGRLLVDFSAIRESRGKPKLLLLLHFAMQIIPLVITIYTCWMIYLLLVPSMGRMGNETHPDIIIGITTALLTFSCVSYWLTLVQISHPVHNYLPWLVGTLASINVITLLLVFSTKMSFPYSGDEIRGPTPQLYFINVERIYRNIKGEVHKSDSGLWLVPNDAVGIEPLTEEVSQVKKAQKISCQEELMCGMPFHLPLISRFKKSYYLKTETKFSLKKERMFKLVSLHAVTENVYRLTFIVKGSNRMNVAISPSEGIALRGWSLSKKPEKLNKIMYWKGRPVYFIYYTHGKLIENWNFWIDLWIPREYLLLNQTLLDVAFICHYLDHPTSSVSDFLENLPNWIHPTVWWATYEKFVF
ncbi:endoplasmic reticulum metallopeptidase 1-like isoform X2 [Centruroides vittatus]|uniref:endoplasmic reticulum metallopeptidase 1-like isoform X2 n=1 Tax=Centruroides vittatus TaxID=120091 RepID=UPI00350F390D